MADEITQEQCRRYQGECRKELLTVVEEMVAKLDKRLTALSDAVAAMSGDVKVIKDRLGINGAATAAATPHPHRRDSEADEHEHKRRTDSFVGILRAFKWYFLAFGAACAYAGKELIPLLEKLLGIK